MRKIEPTLEPVGLPGTRRRHEGKPSLEPVGLHRLISTKNDPEPLTDSFGEERSPYKPIGLRGTRRTR